MKFSELNLSANILKGIDEAGFRACLPVQEKTFIHTLDGKDVCVQSQTGTGKTAAFLISIFHILSDKKQDKKKKALILAPTRELATQIEKEAKQLGRNLDLIIGCFYGGVSYNKQINLLDAGVDIIIGTPGRLIDFGRQGKINFREIEILIIDEADRLFDMGFLPDIRWILRKMPKYNKRQTMLFSATLGYRTREIAWEYMNEPIEIILNPDQITVEQISQELYHVAVAEKMSLLLGILRSRKPGNTLIFTNTKWAAHMVSKRLEYNGFDSQYLIGDLPQKKRHQIIEKIKSGRLQYLVATDVAARGLHIDDLELVVNYDLPEDPESYVHRIGRTGRLGKSGKAITLACEKFVLGLEALESFIDMKIPVIWPEKSFFEKDASEGMHFSLEKSKYERDNQKPKRKGQPGKKPKRKRNDKPERHKEFSKPKIQKEKRVPRKESRSPRKGTPNMTHPSGSEEDRMEYYRRKYGEDFKIVPDPVPAPTPVKKPSWISKIKSLLNVNESEEKP